MNSLLIDNINNNDDMQLDKVIDSYFDHELNPLTECNINSSYYDIETLANSRNVNSKHHIGCMHMNIRSLPNNFDKLKVLLVNLENIKIQFYFILICKTFLTERNHNLYNLPGYSFITRHRKLAKCGGVGIYVRNDFNYVAREDLSTFIEQTFECIFIEVHVKRGKTMLIGEIYRIPNSTVLNPSKITKTL